MREVFEAKTVRVYTQKELAEALGMTVPERAKVTVTNATDGVTIVVRNEKEIAK